VRGKKELAALSDGYRESEESWAELLRDLKKRGMWPPVSAIGDGALGFWAAARDVFPQTRSQRDRVHKTVNVLDALPKAVYRRANKAIHEITEAENEEEAEQAIEVFADEFGTKWPKAVAKIVDERETLLTFFDFPAEHWVHLCSHKPIDSTVAPVRVHTDVTRRPGSRAAGVAMIYKLLEAQEGRWRRINGYHLVPLVRAGGRFMSGELVERSEEQKIAT